jgi:acid phosphatase type 7
MKSMFVFAFAVLLAIAQVTFASVEQIALNFNSDPTQMVVTFASFSDETSAECLYGTDPNNLSQSITASGSKYTLNNYTSPMLFKGTMTNIAAGNKVVYYSVGSKTLGYSPVSSFKSHPGVGTEKVTFHICGDLGQTTNTATTIDDIVSFEADLTNPSGGIISMGDLSYANGDEPLWDSFGNLRQTATNHIPMYTTSGNHEWFDSNNHDFTAYLARFDNPLVNGERQLYYSFDMGLAHIVMVAGMLLTFVC